MRLLAICALALIVSAVPARAFSSRLTLDGPGAKRHGCVRVWIWEAARLFELVPHGETVYVY